MFQKWILAIVASLTIGHFQAQIMWDQAFDIAASHFDNNHPRIATDRSGNPLVIWGKSNDVLFTRWEGTSFLQPVKVNPGTVTVANADWMGPDIAAHGDTVYIVYKQTPEDQVTSHIWCIRSFDGGINFDIPARVDFTGDSLTRFPAITTDEAGQPIIAFMKFNPSFGDARWVVTRSEDFGMTFSPDVKASGWSGPSSKVCDCCPGSIICQGSTVTVVYRDNNLNVRDNWVAVSNDEGRTFSGGCNADQLNWYLESCPASGPDGVMVGDTIYTISMNGGSGNDLVYYNKTSLSDMSCPQAGPVTDYESGLNQNYPRIANFENAVAMVWRHSKNSSSLLGLRFTSDITTGFPAGYDTVALTNVINADVTLSREKVFVVWQDNSSGTVKYKSGTYETRVGTTSAAPFPQIEIYPNPSADAWQVSGKDENGSLQVDLIDLMGRVLSRYQPAPSGGYFQITIPNASLPENVYWIRISDGHQQIIKQVIKQ